MYKKPTPTLLALLLMLVSQLFAQQKQLSIDDLMNRKLYPASLSNIQWRNNNQYTWTANNRMVQNTVKTLSTDTILSLDELNLYVEKNSQKKLKTLPAYKWEDENSFRYTSDSKVFRFNLAGKNLTI